MKILLVEDEVELANFIKKGIASSAFDVDVAYDGRTGKSFFSNNNYDIAILDINVPIINGFELCKQFKAEKPEMPILMLTALDSIEDKTEGFEAGADDYLVKPFVFQELMLRIKALTNRFVTNLGADSTIKVADLEVNTLTKSVLRRGKLIELTNREFDLLEYFLLNKGKVISRVEISEKVWDINFDTNTNVVDVYVNYLRNKIDKNFEPKLIHTVVGMGYVLKDPV